MNDATTANTNPALAAVLDKVQKLLKLSQSPNVHEAALALAKAQKLMLEHQIDMEAVRLQNKAPEEPIVGTNPFSSPTMGAPGRLESWRKFLANVVARHCGVALFTRRVSHRDNVFSLVGRTSDIQAAQYLYELLASETDRLVAAQPKGQGRAWFLTFRTGCVAAYAKTLQDMRNSLREDIERAAASSSTALVRLNALDVLDRRAKEAKEALNAAIETRPAPASRASFSASAYLAGRDAGATVQINGAKGSMATGAKGLTSGR
jgi:hypothetical protein